MSYCIILYCHAGAFSSAAEAEAWAQAAFLIASLPAHNASALTHGLGYAAAYGFFIVGTAQGTAAGKDGQPMPAAQLAQLTADYKCHTNWVGVVLGANLTATGGQSSTTLALATQRMQREAYHPTYSANNQKI